MNNEYIAVVKSTLEGKEANNADPKIQELMKYLSTLSFKQLKKIVAVLTEATLMASIVLEEYDKNVD